MILYIFSRFCNLTVLNNNENVNVCSSKENPMNRVTLSDAALSMLLRSRVVVIKLNYGRFSGDHVSPQAAFISREAKPIFSPRNWQQLRWSAQA